MATGHRIGHDHNSPEAVANQTSNGLLLGGVPPRIEPLVAHVAAAARIKGIRHSTRFANFAESVSLGVAARCLTSSAYDGDAVFEFIEKTNTKPTPLFPVALAKLGDRLLETGEASSQQHAQRLLALAVSMNENIVDRLEGGSPEVKQGFLVERYVPIFRRQKEVGSVNAARQTANMLISHLLEVDRTIADSKRSGGLDYAFSESIFAVDSLDRMAQIVRAVKDPLVHEHVRRKAYALFEQYMGETVEGETPILVQLKSAATPPATTA